MNNLKDFDFLSWCYLRYQSGQTPGNAQFRQTPEFESAYTYLGDLYKNEGMDRVYSYTKESQFLVNLWTAHFILEFFKASDHVNKACIEIVERYANGKLDEVLAREERQWLIDNLNRSSDS